MACFRVCSSSTHLRQPRRAGMVLAPAQPAQQQDVFVAPVYTKKKVPHMGSVFWIFGTPPRNEKKSYKCHGLLFERPETIFGVRENYLAVREMFRSIIINIGRAPEPCERCRVRGHDRCLLLCHGRGLQNQQKIPQNTENPLKSIKKLKKFEKTLKCADLHKHTGAAHLKQCRNTTKLCKL